MANTKTLKFRLNSLGEFQPEQDQAPLGLPIYEVVGVPHGATHAMVLSVLQYSVLSDSGTSYHYEDLGKGRIVRSVQ